MPARQLSLVSPLMRGDDVANVQRRLIKLGYDPGPVDGVYGQHTAAAVCALQRDSGLTVDGIVGPATGRALAATPELPQNGNAQGDGAGLAALTWMRARLGMGEDGVNHNEITEEFGLGDVPWCMETVSLAFKHGAGIVLGAREKPMGYHPDRGFAYVPYFAAWARAAGYWRGARETPAPGDVVVFEWGNDSPEPDHVGIVEQVTGADTFVALEGNQDNALRRKNRNRHVVAGYARIRG